MSDSLHDLCTCGHTAHWHSHEGAGDCEHDGECKCLRFESEIHALARALERAFGGDR